MSYTAYTATEWQPTTSESFMGDGVNVLGRKKEMRQLFRAVSSAKTGQAKSVLVTGAPGIGKTEILDRFVEALEKNLSCVVVYAQEWPLDSAYTVYLAFYQALILEAQATVASAHQAINLYTEPFGVTWPREEIYRILSVAKTQSNTIGKPVLNRELLLKEIKDALPTVKKLRLSLNDQVERIIDILMNPWLNTCVALLQPDSLALQQAVDYARRVQMLIQRGDRPWKAQPKSVKVDERFSAMQAGRTVADIEQDEALDLLAGPADQTNTAIRATQENTPTHHPEGAHLDGLTVDALTTGLCTILSLFNEALLGQDRALVFCIDNWDTLLNTPASDAEGIKALLSGVMKHTLEQKQCHMLWVLSCRSDAESTCLAGELFQLFRTKLLLGGFDPGVQRKFLSSHFKERGITVTDDVYFRISELTRGNPFWLKSFEDHLADRVKHIPNAQIDLTLFEHLPVEQLNDLLELQFTRMQLNFLQNEATFFKVLSCFVWDMAGKPFQVETVVNQLQRNLGYSPQIIFDILRALFLNQFVIEIKREGSAPVYQIANRIIFDFMREKTMVVRTEVSPEEKMAYLKKILPLSIQSGELDREKTREILTLSQSLQHGAELITFMEDLFLCHLHEESAVCRVTALNNLGVLKTQRAVEGMIQTLNDRDPLVREYVVRNLKQLLTAPLPEAMTKAIHEALTQAVQDSTLAVRSLAFDTISQAQGKRFKAVTMPPTNPTNKGGNIVDASGITLPSTKVGNQQLLNKNALQTYMDALKDDADPIRVSAIQAILQFPATALQGMGLEQPLQETLEATLQDSSAIVRRHACLAYQQFFPKQGLERLAQTLFGDADPAVRAAAAEALILMNEEAAHHAVMTALQQDPFEDVKMRIIRVFGRQRHTEAEAVVCNLIQLQIAQLSVSMLWSCVRTLGEVGQTKRAKAAVEAVQVRFPKNEILKTTSQLALEKIQARMAHFQQSWQANTGMGNTIAGDAILTLPPTPEATQPTALIEATPI